MTADSEKEFIELRRGVLRCAVFGLNAWALREDLVAPDGAFDAALANGLARIVSYEDPGAEYVKGGRVASPLELLQLASSITESYPLEILESAVPPSQALRHGRADDEWTALGRREVDALVQLDKHVSLRCIDLVGGSTFDEAVVRLYNRMVDDHGPFDPKEKVCSPEIQECPDCSRQTLICESWDDLGAGPGEGTCIACGSLRTYENVVDDMVAMRVSRSD